MRNIKLSDWVFIFPLLLAASCTETSLNEKADTGICYFVLDFSDLPMSQNDKLVELSMNIHDNYFMYKNLDVNPIRFNEKIYLSLDCERGVEALELDDWMRDMIKTSAKLSPISEEKYISMYEKSTSGIIIVE